MVCGRNVDKQIRVKYVYKQPRGPKGWSSQVSLGEAGKEVWILKNEWEEAQPKSSARREGAQWRKQGDDRTQVNGPSLLPHSPPPPGTGWYPRQPSECAKSQLPSLKVHHNSPFPSCTTPPELTFSGSAALLEVSGARPGASNLLKARIHPGGTHLLQRKLVSPDESYHHRSKAEQNSCSRELSGFSLYILA